MSIDLTDSIKVQAQEPLDIKTQVATLAELSTLGASNAKAYTYHKNMVINCAEDNKNYVWTEVGGAFNPVGGLLSSNFTYPNGINVNGIDYSNKVYNLVEEVVAGSGAVDSVNGNTGVVVLDTDDIAEGATNEYYTEAKVSANIDVAANTLKVGITPTQAAEIAANSAKNPLSQEQVEDMVNTLFQKGSHTNITVTYDDVAGSISLSGSPGGSSNLSQEEVEDFVGGVVAGGTGVTVDYNDAGDQLTISLSGVQFTSALLAKLNSIEENATENKVDVVAASQNIDAAVEGIFHHPELTGNVTFTVSNMPAPAVTGPPIEHWIIWTSNGTNTISFSSDFDPAMTSLIRTSAIPAGEYRIFAVLNRATTKFDVTSNIPPQSVQVAAPSNLAAGTSTQTDIPITWTDNSDNEEGFQIEARPAGGNWVIQPTAAVDAEAATITGLVQGTTYDIRVKATNSNVGDSGYSNVISVATAAGTNMNIPTGLTSGTPGENNIPWSWIDNNGNEEGHELRWSTDNATWTVISLGANITSYDLTGLSASTQHYVQVRAMHATDGDSPWTASATNTTTAQTGTIIVVHDDFSDPAAATIGTRSFVETAGAVWSVTGGELLADCDTVADDSLTRFNTQTNYAEVSGTDITVVQNKWILPDAQTENSQAVTSMYVDESNRIQVQGGAGGDKRNYKIVAKVGGVDAINADTNPLISAITFPIHKIVNDRNLDTIKVYYWDNVSSWVEMGSATGNSIGATAFARIQVQNTGNLGNTVPLKFDDLYLTNADYSTVVPT